MYCLIVMDSIADSMDMNMSKCQEIVKGRGAWRAAVHGVAKSSAWLCNWAQTTTTELWKLKSEIKTSVGLVPSKGWERMFVPVLSSGFCWFAGNLWCFLAYSPCVPVCLQSSPFYKDASHFELQPTLMPHFNLISSLKTLAPKKVTFWSTGD